MGRAKEIKLIVDSHTSCMTTSKLVIIHDSRLSVEIESKEVGIEWEKN